MPGGLQHFQIEGRAFLQALGLQQLVFIMHRELQQELESYLNDNNRKVMDWIELQHPCVIRFDEAGEYFANINTPEMLAALTSE